MLYEVITDPAARRRSRDRDRRERRCCLLYALPRGDARRNNRADRPGSAEQGGALFLIVPFAFHYP